MNNGNSKPTITVSKSGVLQVSPAEIFKSEAGRAEIRKTARLAAVLRPKPAGSRSADK